MRGNRQGTFERVDARVAELLEDLGHVGTRPVGTAVLGQAGRPPVDHRREDLTEARHGGVGIARMVIWGGQRAGDQQVALAEPVHALDPAADPREVLAHVRIGRAVALDRECQSIQPLALLLELGGRQCVGGIRGRVIEHRLDPADDAQPVCVRNRQQVL